MNNNMNCKSIGTLRTLPCLVFLGRIIFVTIRISPSKYKGGDVLLVTTGDITKRLEAEQQLIQASKMATLGEMASGVAHELNQPLQVISGYAEILSQEFSEDHRYYEYIQEIKNHIDRLGKVTKKIMRITKYETLDYIDGVKIIDIHKASKKN